MAHPLGNDAAGDVVEHLRAIFAFGRRQVGPYIDRGNPRCRASLSLSLSGRPSLSGRLNLSPGAGPHGHLGANAVSGLRMILGLDLSCVFAKHGAPRSADSSPARSPPA